jgi:hypothetical protein
MSKGFLSTLFRVVGLHSLCDDAFLLCPTCAPGRLQDVYETVCTVSANTSLSSLHHGPDELVLPAILVSRMSSIGITRSFGHLNTTNQTSERGYAGCLITVTFHLGRLIGQAFRSHVIWSIYACRNMKRRLSGAYKYLINRIACH